MKVEAIMQRKIWTAIGLGAIGGVGLLGALHLSVPTAPATPSALAGAYGLVAVTGAILVAAMTWLSLPPTGEPRPRDHIRGEAGRGMRNGLLVGAMYSVLRLAVFLAPQEYPLWFVAWYAAAIVSFVAVVFAALGAILGAYKANSLR